MTRLRRRVRLSARDWKTIYHALEFAGPREDLSVTEEQAEDSVSTTRKIGVDGMAARDRGVAPVRKGTR